VLISDLELMLAAAHSQMSHRDVYIKIIGLTAIEDLTDRINAPSLLKVAQNRSVPPKQDQSLLLATCCYQ
jgi:hypothetical protein